MSGLWDFGLIALTVQVVREIALGAILLYCCLVSSFGLLVSFQLVIGILQHFSIVLVSYKSLIFLLV